jgi:hypothetical protein
MLRPTRRASVPTSEVSCAISQARCSRGALPSSANVAAADWSWGWVGSVPRRESGSPGGVDSFSIVSVCFAPAGYAMGDVSHKDIVSCAINKMTGKMTASEGE